jgi:hypothetical protein
VEVTHGTPAEGIATRKWLDEHSLPQNVGDTLVELDAQCVDDVRMVIQECPAQVSG